MVSRQAVRIFSPPAAIFGPMMNLLFNLLPAQKPLTTSKAQALVSYMGYFPYSHCIYLARGGEGVTYVWNKCLLSKGLTFAAFDWKWWCLRIGGICSSRKWNNRQDRSIWCLYKFRFRIGRRRTATIFVAISGGSLLASALTMKFAGNQPTYSSTQY